MSTINVENALALHIVMITLNDILKQKKKRIEQVKSLIPLPELKKKIKNSSSSSPADFSSKLINSNGVPALIAEIKKSSPSKGLIRKNFDHKKISTIYQESKYVANVSVLTETDFFHGSLTIFNEARDIISKPMLRKDFTVDEYQIFESRANNVDAVLLIAAILNDNELEYFYKTAVELGLQSVIEIHTDEELDRVLKISPEIIGINNRNLKTFKIDINTTKNLIKKIPGNIKIISESGISSNKEIIELGECGIDAVLIGTAFMTKEDINNAIIELMESKKF